MELKTYVDKKIPNMIKKIKTIFIIIFFFFHTLLKQDKVRCEVLYI